MGKKHGSDKDFGSYMSSALQNSMVTGIPQIAGAGNIPKKVIRALVFVLCVFGFFYQSISFLNLYWEYRTIVDVQVSTPREVDMPAMTVCNRNGIQMSKFCVKYPDTCDPVPSFSNISEFCGCHPRYCDMGELPPNFTVPDQDPVEEQYFKSEQELEGLLQLPEDMFRVCTLTLMQRDRYKVPCNLSDVVSIRSPHPAIERNVCYTLHSLIRKPDAKPKQVLSIGSLDLILDTQMIEYQLLIPDLSMQIAFHDARSLTNPYLEGFRTLDATDYTFIIKKIVKKLLPAPYETRCFDYETKWKERGGYGPLSETDCIQECLLNASLKIRDCVARPLSFPSNERVCDELLTQNEYLEAEPCIHDCKPACLQVSYTATKEEKSYGNVECGVLNTRGKLIVRAKLHSMETTTYIYKPQYEEIETFSYLGGYVGMWLGISLVAVFDFCETVFMMLKYPLSKVACCARRQAPTRVNRRVRQF